MMVNNASGLLANLGVAQGDLILKVKGMDGVNAFNMGANSRAALFDEDNDIFFIKTTDANGRPTVRIFDFTERTEDYPEKYLTMDKFNAFLDSFNEFREEILDGQLDLRNAVTSNWNDTTESIKRNNSNTKSKYTNNPSTRKSRSGDDTERDF